VTASSLITKFRYTALGYSCKIAPLRIVAAAAHPLQLKAPPNFDSRATDDHGQLAVTGSNIKV